LVDCGIAHSRIYLAIRSLDTDGKGYIRLSITELAQTLGISPSTIYRALQDKRFFTRVHRAVEGIKIVSYRALKKVCADLDIDLGAIAMVPLKVLGDRMRSAVLATDLEILLGQTQAEYRAREQRQKKKRGRGKIFNAITAVRSQTVKERENQGRRQSFKCRGLQTSQTGFRYFRIRPHDLCPGISQQSIAKKLNRSRSTIARRGNNRKRDLWGCVTLQKRRVIQEFSPKVEAAVKYHLLADLRCTHGTIRRHGQIMTVGILRVGKEPPKVYRLLTNIYAIDYILKGKRGLRRSVKAHNKRSSKSAHPEAGI
jgi:transcriptional regulator with XRE-family HTH domain